MKVLIFGAKGFLAEHFFSVYPSAVGSTADITDAAAVGAELDQHKPDVVINAAGKTGRPNVDWCEDHKEETLLVNVMGPLVLLHECTKRSIYLVQMGSGCIYAGDNGGKGFTEEDVPNFTGSYYAQTKVWSDQMLKDFPVLTLRIRMPFDGSDHPRNLITKLCKYDRILDVQNSLTYIPDFLAAAEKLIEKRATGLYNIVNEGVISPYEIMQIYKEIVDPEKSFERLTLDDLSEVVKAGRSNCMLSTAKVEGEGIELPAIEGRVREALAMLAGVKK